MDNPDAFLFLSVSIPITAVFIILAFISTSAAPLKTTSAFEELLFLSGMILLLINFLILGICYGNRRKDLKIAEMRLQLQRETDAANLCFPPA